MESRTRCLNLFRGWILLLTRYVAAIDQGTTSSRCILYGPDGNAVRESKHYHRSVTPKPGWVENDPVEILDNVRMCADDVLASLDTPGQAVALGITNQRETTVVWDRRNGKPIYNAINWQDSRTAEKCWALIEQGYESIIKSKTGLPIFPYFSATKLQWILDNVDGAREKAQSGNLLFGTIDTWLTWWLTGGPMNGIHVTDGSNAARTMLFNISDLAWDKDILELFDIPENMLPTVKPSLSREPYGFATFADGTCRIPITALIGDQQSSLVGQTCLSPGQVKNSYGTACAILMNVGSRPVFSDSGIISTVAYILEEGKAVYALEGPTGTTGAAIAWLKDSLGLVDSLDEVATLAASVENNGGVYFVPAFSGLYAPYWDLDVRGTIVGLTAYSDKAHITRATLEAICYQSRDVIDAMERDSGYEVTELRVDGGGTKNQVLMQLQADILGIPVRPSDDLECTSRGAACLAGVAAGFWDDLETLANSWSRSSEYKPSWNQQRRAVSYEGWKTAVARATHKPQK